MSGQEAGPPEARGRTLLTRHPWPPGVADGVWAPLVAGFITLAVGLIGILAGYIQVFPGLASTIYLQAVDPGQPSARLYNVVVSHVIAMLVAFAAVFAFGLATTPSAQSLHAVSLSRVYAATVAMTLTLVGSLAARASHPPAAATASLIALGAIPPTFRDAASIVVSVLIIGGAGEIFRRLRLRGSLRGGASR